MRAYTKEDGFNRSRSTFTRFETRWRMRRDHRIPRDQGMRRHEVGAARAEGRRICAEELEAWHKEREQEADDLISMYNWVLSTGEPRFLLDEDERRYWIEDEQPPIEDDWDMDLDYGEEDRERDEIRFIDKLSDVFWRDHELGRDL